VTIKLSEIQIVPIKPNKGLVAFVSFVVNDSFFVGDVALYTSPSTEDGFRLVYPDKVLPSGKRIQCVHPITKRAGEAVHSAVINKYQELMEKVAEQNHERINTE